MRGNRVGSLPTIVVVEVEIVEEEVVEDGKEEDIGVGLDVEDEDVDAEGRRDGCNFIGAMT